MTRVWLRRLGAMLYDGLLLIALWFLATALWLPLTEGEALPYPGLLRVWLLAVAFLFFGWFWTHGGQTLGLRAWRLKVVRADGGELSWADAARRFALAVPSVALAGIGLWWAAFDNDGGRALHDRWSHTKVVLVAN